MSTWARTYIFVIVFVGVVVVLVVLVSVVIVGLVRRIAIAWAVSVYVWICPQGRRLGLVHGCVRASVCRFVHVDAQTAVPTARHRRGRADART